MKSPFHRAFETPTHRLKKSRVAQEKTFYNGEVVDEFHPKIIAYAIDSEGAKYKPDLASIEENGKAEEGA